MNLTKRISSIFTSIFLLTSFISCSQTNNAEEVKTQTTKTMTTDKTNWNELTPEETRVIINKGTELPNIGEYTNNHEAGTYFCKQCNSALYESDSKFDSHCGWPSFDDEIEGAVTQVPDADGHRTEIICTNCKGHLGHIFKGEGFTEKNARHCVNSISMSFVSKDELVKQTNEVKLDTAIFASGCFWGTEYFFEKEPGVISTQVGYIGGSRENPTYKQVCTGTTGHAEAVRVVFDPTKTDYKTLCKLFYETHDPTQVDRQGPDIGTQYRTEVFYLNDEQKKIAKELTTILESNGYVVATKITKATTFYEGEDYHEHYYSNKGGTPYCHGYTKRF
jgi:peptide methionine sulfoxide reductase msrA/msrB